MQGEWGVEHIDLVFVCRVISNEQEASYSVTITASINVADIDDNDPVFVGEPYRVGVSEVSVGASNKRNVEKELSLSLFVAFCTQARSQVLKFGDAKYIFREVKFLFWLYA